MTNYFKLILLGILLTLSSGHALSSPFIVDDIKIRGLKQITPGMIFNFCPLALVTL